MEGEGRQVERKDDEEYDEDDAEEVDLVALQIWEQNKGFSNILNVI